MSRPQQTGVNGTPVASGSSFYTAMRILPLPQRQAMYAVYAFCRAVDDIADEGGPRQERLDDLDRWRRDIRRLYAGGGETQLTQGLRAPIEAFGLKQEDFLAVIDGMEMDAQRDIRAPTWRELDSYCDHVASAVGRLSVRIFGLDEASGLALSHHLGRALQMTNILRDVDEDAAIGRLYLPKEALEEAGIAERDIGEVLASPALDKACVDVAERARSHFRAAQDVMARCPRSLVRSPRFMGAVYRDILDRLLARGWAPPRREVRPSKPQIIWAILRHGVL